LHAVVISSPHAATSKKLRPLFFLGDDRQSETTSVLDGSELAKTKIAGCFSIFRKNIGSNNSKNIKNCGFKTKYRKENFHIVQYEEANLMKKSNVSFGYDILHIKDVIPHT